MTRHHIPQKGNIYWIDPNSTSGREINNKHRFVVITPKEINQLGVVMTVPVTNSDIFARKNGLTVAIHGHDTTGVAVCNQVRSFDIEARIQAGTAQYVEKLDDITINEIMLRVISIIDPGP